MSDELATNPIETETAEVPAGPVSPEVKTKRKKAQEPEVEAKTEVKPETVEIPEPKPTPATIEVPTREGYLITGRKPTFGDRRWSFMQPEGLNIPATELLPAACIVSIKKAKQDAKGAFVKDADGKLIYEEIKLEEGVFPWFHLEKCGMEGPFVYMNLWNSTYMPSQDDMAFGYLHAMREMSQGNA